MKKSIVSLVAGTLIAGALIPATVALAANKNVQALWGTSTISINGQSVASGIPKLVYGGTTYIQLYSVEQALKKVGITPSWDGQTFNMDTSSSSSSGSSSGSSSNSTITLNQLTKAADGSSTIITGNAINTGSVVHSFTITASFYDANGKLIGVEVGSVEDLPPGQSTSFQTLPTGNYFGAASYKVKVQNMM
ncbi:FxLYD domain-containing protein [Alicyclobacillus tolerans]|uniref:FxLYD domain-containing protein n=1 Tax=Alicyclobacillus tolerans TaxID=90970 RepID=UPI001F3D17D9|nr:FxLYD domain-containing protein [Alicyclobacillus tolerans]MCF8565031.1 FxLYD domain-containing protein [Alicyclobacillus tolerans]